MGQAKYTGGGGHPTAGVGKNYKILGGDHNATYTDDKVKLKLKDEVNGTITTKQKYSL